MGPWGLVTLALGATPVATLELELELLLELEEEPESPFDALLLDFPPALELETAAACSPSLRLPAGRPMAMPASMGAMPRESRSAIGCVSSFSPCYRFAQKRRRHAERYRQSAIPTTTRVHTRAAGIAFSPSPCTAGNVPDNYEARTSRHSQIAPSALTARGSKN